MKRETLKDIAKKFRGSVGELHVMYFKNMLKQEAIKWIKKDIKDLHFLNFKNEETLRWMKRFNITEEDLK